MEHEVEVRFDLGGWSLYFALLELTDGGGKELARLRHHTAERARSRLRLQALADDPTVAALRRLFRATGCDPTRYRPSSEALLRRVLKGSELPAIHPLVDLNNCLSLELAVPCCVMSAGAVAPPYELRSGRPGESYESLKGPFSLEGKPVLVDAEGPCDAPITGSQRVKITPDTRRAWLVIYLPRGVIGPQAVQERLQSLLEAAPVARVLGSCHRPAEPEQT